MKTFKVLLGISLITALNAVDASAYTITGSHTGIYANTNVGGLDTFKAYTNDLNNSNPNTEAAWLNTALGTAGIQYGIKDETVEYYTTDTDGIYAFMFDTANAPDYYIVKNAQYWALFQNVVNLDWAVIDSRTVLYDTIGNTVGTLGDTMNINGGSWSISHVTPFTREGGTPTGISNIPEPTIFSLLGLGLVMILYSPQWRRLNK